MKNTKAILAALGGVILAAVLAAGFFAWCAVSAKTVAIEGDEDEGTDGLETVQAKADKLSRKPVYPCEQSLKEFSAARGEIVAWKDEAFALASAGDRKIEDTTDAAFKEFIVNDARRLTMLPPDATDKIVEQSFEFGPFKPYIAEGKMPESAELRNLQRKWDDVATIIELLASNGVSRVTAIEIKPAGAAAQQQSGGDEGARPRKGGRRRSGGAKAKDDQQNAGVQPASNTYLVTCKMRPVAFVKTLNAFEKSERFMSVDDFSFRLEKDTVAEGLGVEKKEDRQAGGRRGRGRGRRAQAAEEEDQQDKQKFKTITDPMGDPPFEVKLTVTVCDFKSHETAKNDAEAEKEKEEEAKQ